jgi:MerR family transcriptional regulator, thiopeptide resistance regulator
VYGQQPEENIMSSLGRLIPILTYEDIPAAHDFLVDAFGFEAGGVSRNADDQPIHGEVRSGDAPIWLHRVTAEHRLQSPLSSDVANAGLFVYVDDVDAHFERARAAGALIDSEPTDQPYGQREYGARDIEGHRWWFATPTAVEARG